LVASPLVANSLCQYLSAGDASLFNLKHLFGCVGLLCLYWTFWAGVLDVTRLLLLWHSANRATRAFR
jgi:hypothetical protein